MKKVLLLGDSIRMGYQSFVKQEMPDYQVDFPEDNGRFAAFTIWSFNQICKTGIHYDYIHFNNGYWDCNHESVLGDAQASVEEYISHLRRLISYIRATGATPIFATTTPIYDTPEQDGIYMPTNYKNEWIIEYNQAALQLMKEENVVVNDLYSTILKGDRYYKCFDSLHLTEEGYRICAKQVADCIRSLDQSSMA